MAEIGGAVISHAVTHLDALLRHAQPQDLTRPRTRAPKVNPVTDGRVHPQTDSVGAVYNRWRAMEHVWAELGKNRILLQRLSRPTYETTKHEHPLLGVPPPGTMYITKDGLKLRLHDGTLTVEQLQRAGGRRSLTGDEFNHGFMRKQPVLLS